MTAHEDSADLLFEDVPPLSLLGRPAPSAAAHDHWLVEVLEPAGAAEVALGGSYPGNNAVGGTVSPVRFRLTPRIDLRDVTAPSASPSEDPGSAAR